MELTEKSDNRFHLWQLRRFSVHFQSGLVPETFFLQVRVPQSPFSLPGNLSQILTVTKQRIPTEKESDDFQKQTYRLTWQNTPVNVLLPSSSFMFSGFLCLHTWEFFREISFVCFSPQRFLLHLPWCLWDLLYWLLQWCQHAPTSRNQVLTDLIFQGATSHHLRSLTTGITVNLGIHARRGGFVFTCSSAANLHLYFCCYTVPLIFFFYFTWNWSFTNNFTDSALVSFFLGLRRYTPLVQWVDVSVRQSQGRALTQGVADAFQPF